MMLNSTLCEGTCTDQTEAWRIVGFTVLLWLHRVNGGVNSSDTALQG